jgi:hypothetical protein
MSAKAPGVVTLVGIYLWIIALVSAVSGIALMLMRNDAGTQALYDATSSELLITGGVEIVIGLIIAAAAVGLRNGSRGSRTFVAVLMGLRIAATMLALVLAPGAGMLAAALLHILVPVLVLWALYGSDKAEAYFDRQPS